MRHCSNSAGEPRFAGELRFAGQTHFAGPNANSRPNTDHRPNTNSRPQRELPPKRNLLARTQFAGTKTKVTDLFFGASEHDGVFSFPAALGPRAVLVSVCGGQLAQMLGGEGEMETKKQFGLVGTAAPGPDFFGWPGGGPRLGSGSGGVLGFI